MTIDTRAPALRLGSEVWRQVCSHIDGLAVGSTVAALEARGITRLLSEGSRTAGELRKLSGANDGHLAVALRLLADQGWVTHRGEFGADDLTVEPTPGGRALLGRLAGDYAQSAGLLHLAQRLDGILFGGDESGRLVLAEAADAVSREWGVSPEALPVRARLQAISHLDGQLVAPLMVCLARHGLVGQGRLDLPDCDRDTRRSVVRILEQQGWARPAADRDGGFVLTSAGLVAAACARQYQHAVSYIPLFCKVSELLFGDPRQVWSTSPSGSEPHLDRALDVGFSGDVFTSVCREPFLELALPLFDRLPVASQPVAVVDTGCGDGTVLAELYRDVCAHTERGRYPADHPLHMVGVEPSRIARNVAARRLAAAGVPHTVIDGDIADPQGIARALLQMGINPQDALHVNKSVLHDRAYQEPTGRFASVVPPVTLSGAYVAPDGSAIRPVDVVRNLANVLNRWRGLADRHGLIVIEAHAIAPAVTASILGRGVATSLDATHGYSNQYPVEEEAFTWAVRAAGFRSRAHREPAADSVGYPVLTVDHLLPR